MQTPGIRNSVTLYCREGASDKVYQAAIEPRGDGFVVTFAFGRRGGTLQTGVKTPAPVSYAAAKKVYDRLVGDKTAKGYTPGADGTPYTQSPDEARVSGVLPQLLNPVDETEAERLLADPQWWAQEKFDGRRILVRKRGAEVVGINRTGLLVGGLPEPVVVAVRAVVAGSCLLDGEAVGDVYHCFDLLERDGADLRDRPYAVRFAGAADLVDPAAAADALRRAETATTAAAKRAMLDRLRADGQEGVVFKLCSAPYTVGRPASGGTQRKLKFTASASCIVAGVNGSKRSVRLELLEAGRERRVDGGSVTVPPNQSIPKAGEVVEVRYLYAFPGDGGSLYQPVYLGRRDDVTREACTTGQLKLKLQPADPEDEG